MVNMLARLKYFLFPRETNNQKAKLIQISSMFILLFFILGFQIFLTVFTRVKPGILGYASDINLQSLLELTNLKRQENGLSPLASNEQLNEAARQKASYMFSLGCWAHNCNGRNPWWFFKNVGYQYLFAGENLARDFGDSQSVVNAWMESVTHRGNILNPKYKEIGFSVVNGVLNGEETTLVVQLFGTRGGTPEIAGGEKQLGIQAENIPQPVQTAQNLPATLVESTPTIKPLISTFMLTKYFSLFLIVLLLLTFGLDTILIYHQKTVRISSKSFIHLTFFIIILISILLSYQGQIM